MAGLDRFLAKSLDSTIRENLGDKTAQRIENRLFEKYGISLTQSIEQFNKLDTVLREYFGAGADGLEQKFLKSACDVKTVGGTNWITIENQKLTQIILESFGDDDKKRILSAVNGEAMIISQILDKCNIPQTSGYRKINALIDDGLLTSSGFVSTADGKKVSKYRSIFDNVKIDIIKNKITVSIHLAKQDYESSSILSVCRQ
ncbi:transcriptional regulator [Candidatus Nitrosotenuis cloacae]|uniref:transcriptional regulator n=1 Tax=Candidatus Nitrosotenuis cloacae TaxID=1603555 RepID=UPI00228076A2|nr:transcriptional regulator [Candidatus Nitrosotenuis cloacae]